jgi:hypothetical protein
MPNYREKKLISRELHGLHLYDFPFITSINILTYSVLQFATTATYVFLQDLKKRSNVTITP